LYTWGTAAPFLSGIYKVERLREDLSIVHTPHLLFPWYLDTFRNFSNVALRATRLNVESPESVLKWPYRATRKEPVYIDFSTRYSIQFDEFTLRQHEYAIAWIWGKRNIDNARSTVWELL
jgi:hypothetical protein